MTRNFLRTGSAAIAVAAGLIASAAQAQDAAEADGARIIVTAQKREQILIEVPQSISVVSGDLLEASQADSFVDYLRLVPGLQVDQSRQGQSRLIIRGLNTEGVASTVGVYMDETPFGSSSGLVNGAVLAGDFDTFDLDRIEVLRGPQGTFYGASSLSGVLKFVTNAPSTEALEVRARAGLETTRGGDMSYSGNLVVNVPLGDTLAFRASGTYRHSGGFVDSIGSGGSDVAENIDDAKSYGGRASLLWMPSEGFDLRLSAVAQNIYADAPSLVESDPATLGTLYGRFTQSQFVPGFSNLQYRLYNANANIDLGFAQLSSSSSYATQEQSLRTDYTNSLAGLIEAFFGSPNEFFQDQSTDSEKYTQELRLAGTAGPVDWLLGGYYTEEQGLIEQDFIAATPGTTTPVAGLPLIGYALVESEYREVAVFGNVTVHLTDQFSVDVGGRYSDNEQSADQLTDGALVGGLTDFPVFESAEDVFTWSVAPRYAVTENVSVYARAAKGFRPGGPNVLPPGAPASFASYESDSVVSYEFGVKGESADGMFGADIALFTIDWDNIQLLASENGFNFNANGGGARSMGLEFAFSVRPVAGLTLSVNGAATDAELTTDTLIGGLNGDPLPFTPKFSASANADYRWALADGVEVTLGGSLRHVSQQSASFDTAYRTANGRQRQVDGYQVLDLNAGVDLGQFSISIYARNLTDADGRTSTTGTDVFGGFPLFPAGAIGTGVIRPRSFGISLGAEL